MATKSTSAGSPALGLPATPDTLSDRAAEADLGQISPKAALQISVCEAQLTAKHAKECGELQVRLRGIQERHRACLRELREKCRAITTEAFVLVFVGLFGGFIVRALSQTGTDAIKDIYVGFAIFFIILCLAFLAARYFGPTIRKTEITEELKSIDEEIKP